MNCDFSYIFFLLFILSLFEDPSQSKTVNVVGGFIMLVCTIALIAYGIFRINRK